MTATEGMTDVRRANARLRTLLTRTDRDFALAKQLLSAVRPAMPELGPGLSVDVHFTPGHPIGTDGWVVTRTGSVVKVVLFDAAGPATPAGAAVPPYVHILANRWIHLPPGQLLDAMNRELAELTAEDPPVVAATALEMDTESGKFAIARAGSPRPQVITADGTTSEITIPGPLLGVFAGAEFPEHAGELRTGESIQLTTDGDAADDATRIVVFRASV
jgi:serine phosphatase RsbU (regulator of sigma subunit)